MQDQLPSISNNCQLSDNKIPRELKHLNQRRITNTLYLYCPSSHAADHLGIPNQWHICVITHHINDTWPAIGTLDVDCRLNSEPIDSERSGGQNNYLIPAFWPYSVSFVNNVSRCVARVTECHECHSVAYICICIYFKNI